MTRSDQIVRFPGQKFRFLRFKTKEKEAICYYYGSRRLRIFVERKYILFQSAMGTSTRIFRIKPMTASVVFQFKLLDLGQAYNWSLVSFPFTQFFIHTYKYSRRFRLTNGVALICAASRDSRASRGLLQHQISSRTQWSNVGPAQWNQFWSAMQQFSTQNF